jgi:hypothetical protein
MWTFGGDSHDRGGKSEFPSNRVQQMVETAIKPLRLVIVIMEGPEPRFLTCVDLPGLPVLHNGNAV